MSETLIKVENLSKKFTRNLKRSMFYGSVDVTKGMIGLKPNSEKLRKSEFWALQDINFELKRGEVLGLIGKNGCGKSTLLRLLTGIFPPDKGRITMKGRIGALIAVGAGFHPHMTGRENIYLNGTLLGMNRREIKKRFIDIVEFAEIGEFIDAPVATYSSGMRVRLGFAIAVHIEPDILLIDEVLAVGDMGFKIKSLNKISELIKKTCVVFVSHSMQFVGKISTEIMVLEKGCVAYQSNDIPGGIDYYNNLFKIGDSSKSGNLFVDITEVEIFNHTKNTRGNRISTGFNDNLSISFIVQFKEKIDYTNLSIFIGKPGTKEIINITNEQYLHYKLTNSGKNNYKIEVNLGSLNLNLGKHVFTLIAANKDTGMIHLRYDNAAMIDVEFFRVTWADIYKKAEWKIIE